MLLEDLEDLRRKNLYRIMPPVSGLPGRFVSVSDRLVLNFSSNNYLGLAGHPEIIKAMNEAARLNGAGSTASRLIAGNTVSHRELETFIARWKITDAAVVFVSGYQANLGVLSALCGEQDLIVSDKLNHASIIDGCRLSRAQTKIYDHLDLNTLEELLKTKGFRRKLVVTESVFSMDGDYAPLEEIRYLANLYGAALMVDEAHATGVLGPDGRGLAAEMNVEPDIQMGTLGKAAGVSGAYVAGSKELVEILTNKARSLIYTTAASPAIAGGALKALQIIASDEGEERRLKLRNNVEAFHKSLLARNIKIDKKSHIVPVRIGGSADTMKVSSLCLELGVFAHGIRYPTVPEGAARIRFTLTSEHTSDDLHDATRILEASLNSVCGSSSSPGKS
jgi:8-amino-7-oxononanoate synthase